MHSVPLQRFVTRFRLHLVLASCGLALCLTTKPASAGPSTPISDDTVLEVLPGRAADPRMQALRTMRSRLAGNPRDVDTAVRLARRYYEDVAAEGDPRYIGYAQAALAPWWNDAAPPTPVRVMRAILLQFNHQFEAALADLDAVVAQDPAQGEAWAWQAAIRLVQGDTAGARRACGQVLRLGSPLIGAACAAQVDALTGRAGPASQALQAALAKHRQATPEEQLWALTRLAETEERLGRHSAAEAAFQRALALGLIDGYLLAAYADFLLDRGRPAEVLALLKDKARSDLLLLRLTLAAKALGDPRLGAWQNDLAARFAAAGLRGDTVHQKEESRFVLGVLTAGPGQAPELAQRALRLARENYAVQREPADARILLEAALAARQPAAAEPVLQWMAASGVESQALQSLARRLKGGS